MDPSAEPPAHTDLQLSHLTKRYDLNYQRAVRLLLHVFRGMKADDPDSAAVGDDVIRSAIVFIHAAMEDFIRSVGRLRYPVCKGALLTSIPLPGFKGEKFTLADLSTFCDSTVADVVQRAVDGYFSRKTFNSGSEVMGFLRSVKIECIHTDDYLPFINELQTRRHCIVHQADLPDDTSAPAKSITMREVVGAARWTLAVDALVFNVLAELTTPEKKAEALAIFYRALDRLRKGAEDGNFHSMTLIETPRSLPR